MLVAKRHDPPRVELWRDFDFWIRRTAEELHFLAWDLFCPDDTRTILRAHAVVRPTRGPLNAVAVLGHPCVDRRALLLQPRVPGGIAGYAFLRAGPVLDRRAPRAAVRVQDFQFGELFFRIGFRKVGRKRERT